MKIRFGRIFIMLFFSAVIAAGLFITTMPHSKVMVRVPFGAKAQDVINSLSDNGLIASRRAFLFLLRATNSVGRVKAGMYEFSPRENMFSIWEKLTSGITIKLKVTVPEGYTVKQAAELFESKGLFGAAEFEDYALQNNLEGYLFPETYFLDYFHTPKQVASIMKNQFEKMYTPELDQMRIKRNLSAREHIILASIIEKETKLREEKPLVSAVFHNRLKKRMYLESCATVQYALGGWKKRLTFKDLEVNSPYNTYINFGLPPGPICSPGYDSLFAAVNPADVDYLYFVADGLGGNLFYSRYSEHLKGRDSLIKFRREYERNNRKK